jgi:NitT/TauT family transport system ATP-binding protein
MQARPGRIVDDNLVPFPRPRTVEMTYSAEFVALTHRLRELIFAARSAPEAAA